jgi:PKHD-type hydroxylase
VLIEIPALFSAEEAAQIRRRLSEADWVDGKVTAGAQSAQAKRNQQLPESSALARELGDEILKRLAVTGLFMAAALPDRIYPPLFNRYAEGHDFGDHVDNAIRPINGTRERVRTDLSATLFLEDPEAYDGGELVVRDTYGHHAVKLPAGHLVLYPGSSLHRVEPVTRGVRVASFFWIQSLVRDDGARALLLDMDVAIQRLTRGNAEREPLIQLTGVYHNLLRKWAEV